MDLVPYGSAIAGWPSKISQKRRMELCEEESRKLAEESNYFKKENEVAAKHLIDMDKVNQDRLKQLRNTIEKQVDKISAMAK